MVILSIVVKVFHTKPKMYLPFIYVGYFILGPGMYSNGIPICVTFLLSSMMFLVPCSHFKGTLTEDSNCFQYNVSAIKSFKVVQIEMTSFASISVTRANSDCRPTCAHSVTSMQCCFFLSSLLLSVSGQTSKKHRALL